MTADSPQTGEDSRCSSPRRRSKHRRDGEVVVSGRSYPARHSQLRVPSFGDRAVDFSQGSCSSGAGQSTERWRFQSCHCRLLQPPCNSFGRRVSEILDSCALRFFFDASARYATYRCTAGKDQVIVAGRTLRTGRAPRCRSDPTTSASSSTMPHLQRGTGACKSP
jgi:hypothetical protein